MPLVLLAALLPGKMSLRDDSSLLLQWEERIIPKDYSWSLVANFPENSKGKVGEQALSPVP
jgi:hypothetical protein